MASPISGADLNGAFELLRRHSSLEVVSNYLKNRRIPSSASSWSEMREKRFEPALAAGELTRNDVLALLRDAEEFGKQHVFLFQCEKAIASVLLEPSSLINRLKKANLLDVYEKPLIVQKTNGMQTTDIRIQSYQGRKHFVFKVVDTRTYRKLIDKQISGSREILTYDLEYERAVNVVSVREDGLTEIRIQSHRNTLDYLKEVDEMFAKAAGVLDTLQFGSFSLAKTRLYMIKNRTKLSRIVRFHDNLLRDREGNAMTLASGGRQQNLFAEGSASDKGLAAFMSVGRPTCDEVNCDWLKVPDNPGPSTDIHTLIEGANNEFVVTAHCEPADYAYVLEKITSFAQK